MRETVSKREVWIFPIRRRPKDDFTPFSVESGAVIIYNVITFTTFLCKFLQGRFFFFVFVGYATAGKMQCSSRCRLPVRDICACIQTCASRPRRLPVFYRNLHQFIPYLLRHHRSLVSKLRDFYVLL